MDGQTVLSSLRQMCRDIDAGRPLRRINLGRALGTAIIGFSLAVVGCPERVFDECVACYGVPAPPPAAEICDDGIDNDGDGHLDCADDACATDDACPAITEYAAPFPGIMPESADDGDAGEAVAMYARPFERPGNGRTKAD